MLTAAENRYLDANPYALLLWPSDRVSLALATLASGRHDHQSGRDPGRRIPRKPTQR